MKTPLFQLSSSMLNDRMPTKSSSCYFRPIMLEVQGKRKEEEGDDLIEMWLRFFPKGF